MGRDVVLHPILDNSANNMRDHHATTLALAAMRPLGTISTFTVWKSAREMIDMVHGRSAIEDPKRHAAAMVERSRKDFHVEFTTLRFSCIGEYGAWEGRSMIVPRLALNVAAQRLPS